MGWSSLAPYFLGIALIGIIIGGTIGTILRRFFGLRFDLSLCVAGCVASLFWGWRVNSHFRSDLFAWSPLLIAIVGTVLWLAIRYLKQKGVGPRQEAFQKAFGDAKTVVRSAGGLQGQEAAAGDDRLPFGENLRNVAEGQRIFERFRPRRLLGRGGMGLVWLAFDEKLEREVALKFLPEAVRLDEEAIRDLKREARRCLELTHPHIVRIYDFLEDQQMAGISMEYVDGGSLRTLKAQRPNGCLDVNELRPLMAQLCEGLGYAHEKAKVVHRDLKPANLMITRGGELKITDFGISRSLVDSRTRLTCTSLSSGTLPYMSPQQLVGEDPSPSDDIYSLGAVLYELLTGKTPFHTGDLALQVVNTVPPPMAERRAKLGNQGEPIPPEWEATVAACLAKDPSERPGNMREVARRLGILEMSGGHTGGEPVSASSRFPGKGTTLLERGKGRSWSWAAIIFAVLLVAAAGSWYFGPRKQSTPQEVPLEPVSRTNVEPPLPDNTPQASPEPAPPSSTRADETVSVLPAAEPAPPAHEEASPSPEPSIIKSSVGSIGAFSKNWPWSKDRQQDGEYAETKLEIELPQKFKSATLVLKHSYSQSSGKANARVYLSRTAQVAPGDAEHNKGNWWVGRAVGLDELVGSFASQFSDNPPAKFDLTDLLQKYPSRTYYVAVQNLAPADMGVSQIFIEIIK